jgi:hypothetical protein
MSWLSERETQCRKVYSSLSHPISRDNTVRHQLIERRPTVFGAADPAVDALLTRRSRAAAYTGLPTEPERRPEPDADGSAGGNQRNEAGREIRVHH